MTKEELQFLMIIIFILIFFLSSYKVYTLFNTPVEGIDKQTQDQQLENIFINFLKEIKDPNTDLESIYENLIQLHVLQDSQYKNFNRNHFNQLIQRLYLTYKVDSLEQLIKSIHNGE